MWPSRGDFPPRPKVASRTTSPRPEGEKAVLRIGNGRTARRHGLSRARGLEVSLRGAKYALVALRPRTGRTHQLRVHMQCVGCPILGDPVYGTKDARFPDASLMLHARKLRIKLPGAVESFTFSAEIPTRFRDLVAILGRPEKSVR